jgi:hypothetical protein
MHNAHPAASSSRKADQAGGRTFSDTQWAASRFQSLEEGEEKQKTKDFAELFCLLLG